MSRDSAEKSQLERLVKEKATQRELLRRAVAHRLGVFPAQQTVTSDLSIMNCLTYGNCSVFKEAKCIGQRPKMDFRGRNCLYYRPPEARRTASSIQPSPTVSPLKERETYCSACGAAISRSSLYCIECGQQVADLQEVNLPSDQSNVDERVYDYIAKHNGDIFLSKACDDLNLSKEEIEGSFERLKRVGKIS